MYQGQAADGFPVGGYAPQAYGGHASPYAGAYGGYEPPRSGTKTFFIAGLLSLIPLVGFGMAAIYYYTKDQPHAFDGGKAAGAGFVAFLAACAVGFLVWFAVFAVFFGIVSVSANG
jgi:hypothetical protein